MSGEHPRSGEVAARARAYARVMLERPNVLLPVVLLVLPVGVVVSVASGRTFLVVVAGVLLVGSVSFRRARTRTEQLAGSQPITAATMITGLRAVGIAVVAGFGVAAMPTGLGEWGLGLLFGLVAALDLVDGAVARYTGTVTELGRRLDAHIDALVVLVGATVAVVSGMAPGYYLVAGVAWYGFRAGIWWRTVRGLSVHPLPRSRVRRPIGALQLVAICTALLPVTAAGTAHVLLTVAMIPLVGGFLRDWLAVCGYE